MAAWSHIVGGWQVNNILSFYSGTPFSVTASGTSLNAPENDQRADQVKSDVEILGGIGPTSAYFDPLAFAPVTEALRHGPIQRAARTGRRVVGPRHLPAVRPAAQHGPADPHGGVQRHEPAAVQQSWGNVSNLRLNPDGSVANLNGYAVITGTQDGASARFGSACV